MKLNKGWRGYISSREIAGNIIPQRIQNLVIRNYAQAKEMLFLLSATEYYMDNCYMMLNRLLEETDNLAGIIFYSINLLPLDLLKRKQIYRKILEQGCELHFALEELVIREEDDLELVEDVIVCRSLASKSNQIKLLEV
jgi:sporadic carbohydrate cluster protein (TIGR04323 family)